MAEAKDLEIEISTEGVRSLLEIGFDLGAAAQKAGALRDGEPNPFRRAATVIECAKCKHSLAADGRCHSIGCECDCDNSDTARLPSDVVKQLERVEADAEANARAHAQATAEHYTEVARALTEPKWSADELALLRAGKCPHASFSVTLLGAVCDGCGKYEPPARCLCRDAVPQPCPVHDRPCGCSLNSPCSCASSRTHKPRP